jgi:hypothetical protein
MNFEKRIGRTIKQLRAGNFLFTEQNFAAVILVYSLTNFLRMMFENAQNTGWALRFAPDEIFYSDGDQLKWLEHISLECEEWLIPAMEQIERAKGKIMGSEQCREFIRGLSQYYIDKFKRERGWESFAV